MPREPFEEIASGNGFQMAIRHKCGQDHHESIARVIAQDVLTCSFCRGQIEVTDEHRAKARELVEMAKEVGSLPGYPR